VPEAIKASPKSHDIVRRRGMGRSWMGRSRLLWPPLLWRPPLLWWPCHRRRSRRIRRLQLLALGSRRLRPGQDLGLLTADGEVRGALFTLSSFGERPSPRRSNCFGVGREHPLHDWAGCTTLPLRLHSGRRRPGSFEERCKNDRLPRRFGWLRHPIRARAR
jgi:hypothetical protein